MYTPALATAGTTPIVMSGFSTAAEPPAAEAGPLHAVAAASIPAAVSIAPNVRSRRVFATAARHDIRGAPDNATPSGVSLTTFVLAKARKLNARRSGTMKGIDR
jgi:hypothetical protein